MGDEEGDAVSYSISGNFNGWEGERMMEGEIPGLFTATAEIPSSGSIEFHFLKNGDDAQRLVPQAANCSSRLTPILGPGSDQTNTWVVSGPPGSDMQIELLIQKNRKSHVASALMLGACDWPPQV